MRFRLAIGSLCTVFVLGGLVTACAGSDKASTETSAIGAASTATTKLDLGSGGGKFCDTARTQAKAFLGTDSPELQAALTGIVDPSKAAESKAALKGFVEKSRKANAAFIADAPAELKDSLNAINTLSTKLFDALSKADYDFQKVDISSLALDDSKLEDATKKLETYLKDKCGITLKQG